jgi:hypothetical protein
MDSKKNIDIFFQIMHKRELLQYYFYSRDIPKFMIVNQWSK